MKRSFYALLCAMLMCCAFLFVACDEDKDTDTDHTHSYTEEITKAATCAEAGTKTLTCSCGDVKTEEIPATGNHTYGAWTTVTEATCGKDGSKTRTCTTPGCNHVDTGTIPATGNHSYGEWESTTPPTCGESGLQKKTCSVCGDIKTEAIPATGNHNYEDGACTVCGKTDPAVCTHEWKDATCTEPKTCSKCGTTEGAANGHSYGEWETVTEATCTTPGSKKQTCSGCGDVKTEAIPATGKHTYGAWTTVTEATCTTAGSKKQTCSGCGDVKTEAIPATGKHNYVDGTCKDCGAKKPASNEQLVADILAGNSSTNANTFASAIGALKDYYKQLPEMPEIDINEFLSQFSVYVNANANGGNTVISVKDGYITYRNSDGAKYIGYNNGYIVVTDGTKVTDYTEIIPAQLAAILGGISGGISGGIPEEQLDAIVEFVQQEIIAIFKEIGTLTADEITLKDGWYQIDFSQHIIDAYGKDDSALKALLYMFLVPTEGDEETIAAAKAQVDAMVTGFLSEFNLKCEVLLNNEADNAKGIRISGTVPDTTNLMGGAGSIAISFEIMLSDDVSKTESIKFDFACEVPDFGIAVNAGVNSSFTYSESGVANKTTVEYELTKGGEKANGAEMTFEFVFDEKMNPTKINVVSKLSDADTGSTHDSVFKAEFTYPEDGGTTVNISLTTSMTDGGKTSTPVSLTAEFGFDKLGALKKLEIGATVVSDCEEYAGVSVEFGVNYVPILVAARKTVKVEIKADIAEKSSYSFSCSTKYTDKKYKTAEYYGFDEATEQVILKLLSEQDKQELDTRLTDISYEATCTAEGGTYDATFSSKENDVCVIEGTATLVEDTEAKKRTLTVEMNYPVYKYSVKINVEADLNTMTAKTEIKVTTSDGTVTVTVDVDLDSKEATAPSQDVIDLILNFTPPTDESDGGFGDHIDGPVEIVPDETNPDETNPDETNPDETNPGEVNPDEAISFAEIVERCRDLKKQGEIAEFNYYEEENGVSAQTADGNLFGAQEFDSINEAEKTYKQLKASLDEVAEEGKDYFLTMSGNIVIMSTSKDLYNKIVNW